MEPTQNTNQATLQGGILSTKTGTIPELSLAEWDKATHRGRYYEACPSAVKVETLSHFPTKADIAAVLPNIKGRDADFAKSLADYFNKNGNWSPKQFAHANRLYVHYERAFNAAAATAMGHKWERVGETSSANIHLGTYSNRQYDRCSCCGAYRITTQSSNYSGD